MMRRWLVALRWSCSEPGGLSQRGGDQMRRLALVMGAVFALLWGSTSASAVTPGALSPADASARCAAFFGVSASPDPEPLSACQWDMRDIGVGAASYARATGAGVSVGVIDAGVDLTHPDLAGAIDVAR